MSRYPIVLSERDTLERAIAGQSLARFGDGELRIAIDSGCTSQVADAGLAKEFRAMLSDPKDCLVAIPNLGPDCPKLKWWKDYRGEKYTHLYRAKSYGSSFITRPDNAPWIDTQDYWDRVGALWRGRDVTLVCGDRKSLRHEDIAKEAKSVRLITGPVRHAYAEIDSIEKKIGMPFGTVLLCLGACATALAFRLSQKGIHAVDLGHIGMFMRHAGSYRFERKALISDQLLEQNAKLHAGKKRFGADGWRHVDPVQEFARSIAAQSILDYGCGEGTLKAKLREAGWTSGVNEYDPAVPEKSAPAKPADLVACTDVMEHVEPDLVDNVLAHIKSLAGLGCYMVVATRPANTILPNGKNAHLIVESGQWWIDRVKKAGFTVLRSFIKNTGDGKPHEVRLWLKP